jgi:hypothetical protein
MDRLLMLVRLVVLVKVLMVVVVLLLILMLLDSTSRTTELLHDFLEDHLVQVAPHATERCEIVSSD